MSFSRKKPKERGALASISSVVVLFANSIGIPMERITKTTGLEPTALMDPDTHIPHKFLLKLWLMLAKARPGKNISLELAKVVPFRLLGSPGRVMSLSSDLRTMLELFEQYHDLISDQLDVELIDNSEEVTLRMDHVLDDSDDGIGAEIGLGIAVRIFQELFGDGTLARVNFRHTARSPLTVYEDFFPVPVIFQAPVNSIGFHSETLDRPNKRSGSEMKSALERRLDNLRKEFDAENMDELSDIWKAIDHQTKKGDYTVKGLALRMAMSVRSLQRLIRESGTSARSMLNEARYNNAMGLLTNKNLSIEEVAFQLDFDSYRSFRRAFGRWAQKSPAQVRRELWGT